MIISVDGFCEIGMERKENKDQIFIGKHDSGVLAVLADGMGGHQNGALASKIICGQFSEWWSNFGKRELAGQTFEQTMSALEVILQETNQKIFSELSCGEVCGSTALVFWSSNNKWGLLGVGDSRCYQLQRNLFFRKIVQRSVDDVWEQQVSVRKKYASEELKRHPNYGRLTNAVGAKKNLIFHRTDGHVKKQEVFLLCSDGVYRYCDAPVLRDVCSQIKRHKDIRRCMVQLSNNVYLHGAPDNLSAIILKIDR